MKQNINQITRIINKLNKKDKELINRIFNIEQYKGRLQAPKEMLPWLREKFGSYPLVKEQKITRINNKITYEGALFNELRTKRPIIKEKNEETKKIINESKNDPFCKPEKLTPKDSFGRIKGEQSITASNIAKYDAEHGLIIFKEHNPLTITKESFKDHFLTAIKWFEKAHKENPEAKYPFLMWNCLWKAASSIIHGHFQTTLARNEPYERIKYYNKKSEEYEKEHGKKYWEDLWLAHKKLGLGKTKNGKKLFVSLTPIKEKETIIISEEIDENLIKTTYHVIERFIKKLGVNSFNMGVYLKPMSKEEWHLPIIVRIVDRGSINSKTTDIGAMELFTGQNVIGTDPYKVIKEL